MQFVRGEIVLNGRRTYLSLEMIQLIVKLNIAVCGLLYSWCEDEE